MKIERIIDILFDEPDAFDECDGCSAETGLLEMADSETLLYFCRDCYEADDRRGEMLRHKLSEWWEQSKEDRQAASDGCTEP